jgi:hypothetical protein
MTKKTITLIALGVGAYWLWRCRKAGLSDTYAATGQVSSSSTTRPYIPALVQMPQVGITPILRSSPTAAQIWTRATAEQKMREAQQASEQRAQQASEQRAQKILSAPGSGWGTAEIQKPWPFSGRSVGWGAPRVSPPVVVLTAPYGSAEHYRQTEGALAKEEILKGERASVEAREVQRRREAQLSLDLKLRHTVAGVESDRERASRYETVSVVPSQDIVEDLGKVSNGSWAEAENRRSVLNGVLDELRKLEQALRVSGTPLGSSPYPLAGRIRELKGVEQKIRQSIARYEGDMKTAELAIAAWRPQAGSEWAGTQR